MIRVRHTGSLQPPMLNDILAASAAGAVVAVIGTILGTVELLRKAVSAIIGR